MLLNLTNLFSFKNGFELIITFLIILNIYYTATATKKAPLRTLMVVFYAVLLSHFLKLNVENYAQIPLDFIPGWLLIAAGLVVFTILPEFVKGHSLSRRLWLISAAEILAVLLLLMLVPYSPHMVNILYCGSVMLVILRSHQIVSKSGLDNPGFVRWYRASSLMLAMIFGLTPALTLVPESVYYFIKIPFSLLMISFLLNNLRCMVGQPNFFLVRSMQKEAQISADPEIYNKLKKAMEEERLFKNQELTSGKLAQLIEEPNYKVVKVIKLHYQKSFPEFINSHRIQEATKILSSNKDEFVKIEALAKEVGFKSPSAFYNAFKRNMGKTPTEFRDGIK